MATANDSQGAKQRPPQTRRILRIDATIWGVTAGLLCGFGLFAATNWLLLQDGPQTGKHLSLLRHYFIGFEMSFVGSLIGFAWAFATAFIATWLFVRVYNWVAQKRNTDTTR